MSEPEQTEPASAPEPASGRAGRALVVLGYLLAWAVLAGVLGTALFLNTDRAVTVASHDAVITPTLSSEVVVNTGPVLPDLRLDSGSRLGVEVQLGKTDAESTEALVARYGYLASQPDGVESRIRSSLEDMALEAAVRGALLAAVPVLVWLLIGRTRRRELLAQLPTWRGLLAVVVAAAIVAGVVVPWGSTEQDEDDPSREWTTLADFLGPEVPLPDEAARLEVRGDVTTSQTRRLIESAVDTYEKSKTFYATAAEAAADLDLRTPAEDETVAVLVSDRHDNIGMDKVARAIGDAAGASAVFDAGDDTSTGRTWEAFSLDSITAAFDDGPYQDQRWAVAGNHDHGSFVSRYLADLGWTMLDGEVVEGPDGSTLLGVDDPRSSGLGSWRDETGLSFEEVGDRLADAACAAAEDEGQRVGTVLVHDANLGREALRRGCVDLVVGGHLHVQSGPDPIVAEGGDSGNEGAGGVGWTYTTGTTGGAAYAIAVGSKIRRAAQVSLLTYRDGRPVGIQAVDLQTNGRFEVGDYVALQLDETSEAAAVR
ncbi:metallophosphoesterase [Nocardioides pantholopis]|uniref:metallophosphoesterase n=1 Tax=Nocardioides pantholopis TaxID=2483798 RepID=UPI001F497C8B|nr:metallophosphoesterase [Nocardioides pantholopis]